MKHVHLTSKQNKLSTMKKHCCIFFIKSYHFLFLSMHHINFPGSFIPEQFSCHHHHHHQWTEPKEQKKKQTGKPLCLCVIGNEKYPYPQHTHTYRNRDGDFFYLFILFHIYRNISLNIHTHTNTGQLSIIYKSIKPNDK